MFTRSTGPRISLPRSFSLIRWFVVAAFALLATSQQSFAQTATTTTLSITNGSGPVTTVSSGTVVTLTATVTAGSTPVSPGQVKFCDATAAYCEDFHIVGTAQLTSAGTAALKFRPTLGSHSYKAVFIGTKTNATSTSAASSLSVTGPAPTSTTLSNSGTNAAPSLSATVGSAPSSQLPTGKISYIDTNHSKAVVGTATLSSSNNTWQLSTSANFSQIPGSSGAAFNPFQYPVVADFNGDGIPDIAIALENSVVVYLGNGNGTFTQTRTSAIPSGVSGTQVAVGDFNGDGIPDLAFAGYGPAWILLGKGDGTFTAKSSISSIVFPEVVVGDFNNDGISDLATTAAIFIGNGDGTFTQGPSTPAACTAATETGNIVAADFNGDGNLDLACLAGNSVDILLGKGDGTFTAATPIAVGVDTWSLAEADFNGDGIPDLAVLGTNGKGIVIYLGTGNGNFTAEPNPLSSSLAGFAVGDFNGDGIPDLAAPYGNGVVLYLGSGTGTFSQSASVSYPNTTSMLQVNAGDFNGDGLSDVVGVPFDGDPQNFITQVFVSLTSGQQSSATLSPTLTYGIHNIAASYSGDSNFAASTSGTVIISNQQSTTLTLSATPSSGLFAGQTTLLTATLSPYTNSGGSSNGESVTFSEGGSPICTGTLSNGVATCSLQILFTGSQSFSAAYSGDAYFTGSASNSITITATAAPTTLTLSAAPSSGLIAGQTTLLTATLSPYSISSISSDFQDLSFYNGSTFMGYGRLSGGVATLTSSPLAAGSQSLSVSYPGNSLLAPRNTSITVSVAKTQPSLTLSATPGSTVQGQTAILMATLSGYYGSGSNEPITFMIGSQVLGTGTLSGGTATLKLSTLPPGASSLTATYPGDTSNVGATSNTLPYTVYTSQAATTTTLALTSGGSSATSVSTGSVVTLTATVMAGSTPVTRGLVKFCDAAATYCEDFHIIGTAQLTSAGTAVLKFRPAIGSHTYKAVFAGTNINVTSSSTVSSLAVTGIYGTATTLSWDGSTADPTLTSSVKAFTSSPSPTGSVSFVDTSNGNAVLGTVPLGASTATPSLLTSASLANSNGAFAIADFNRDGIPDMVLSTASGVTVYFGNGDGTFAQTPAITALPGNPYASGFVVSDFNSDGIPDLAIITYLDGNYAVAILQGKGDGTFTIGSTISAGPPNVYVYPFAGIIVADFNNDGVPDLLVEVEGAGYTSYSYVVLFGNGDGTFPGLAGGVTTTNEGFGSVVADWNGDGILDLANFSYNGSTEKWQINTLLGNGDGTFTAGTTLPLSGQPNGILTADFNGDGNPDLVASAYPAYNNSTQSYSPNNVTLFTGKGGGTFNVGHGVNPSTALSTIIVGDFNGDGIPDIAGSNETNNGLSGFSYLLGKGDGTFTQENVQTSISYGASPATADFNGDGISDLAMATVTSPQTILVGLTSPLQSTVSLSPNLTDSTHVIEATYSGNSNFLPSISPTVTINNTVPTGPAVITSPVPGTKLSGSTVTFTWTPGSGVSVYQISVGTKWPGAIDIYGGGATTATSATVTGIPTNGIDVYVMLRSVINGVVYTNFYTYTAAGSLTPPALIAPAPNSHLGSSTVTFKWSPGNGPTAYLLNIGTKWPGADDIYGTGVTTATSVEVPGLPTNGVNVYVQLRYFFNGVWTDINYTYTAEGTTAPPVLFTPAPGSQLTGSTAIFQWTNGPGVTGYTLSVGTYGPGYFNIYSSPLLTSTVAVVPNIPTNGKPVYVMLRYQINGVWQTANYTYTAQ
ncbi:beta strand repeat-containing protein [Terracidiphilus gabretensis]|uniref:beta strand repeat-containing protein n=1 Tax=Terracidiphilus gabretensis TaxID=1577687 RepID=UPI00071BE4D6|nr:FG-GAP-like repeat-containing protein [Terracidiphilus gabretensis]